MLFSVDATPYFVIGTYHHLWHVEHSFRMSKHDLRPASMMRTSGAQVIPPIQGSRAGANSLLR